MEKSGIEFSIKNNESCKNENISSVEVQLHTGEYYIDLSTTYFVGLLIHNGMKVRTAQQ